MATKTKLPAVPPARNRQWLVYAAIVVLLVWYFFSAVSAVATKSTTFDEVFHLTGGYSSWKFGDFSIQAENGILPQRWAAIPLLFTNTAFPNLNQEAWRQSKKDVVGEQFFYKVGNDADTMLLRGRAMIALFGVALGALIFVWTRSLLSVGPALLSLTLFAFCPTVLANGALVTSDMAAALFFLGSMFCIWRVLHQVNWRTLLVGAAVVGGLFVSKFSAFMIVPMALVLLVMQLLSREPTVITFGGKTWDVPRRRWRLLIHLATIAVYAVVVWIIIWAAYNFRFEMHAAKTIQAGDAGKIVVDEQPDTAWDELAKDPGPVLQGVARMRDAYFLPEAYLYGFGYTWKYAQARRAFLNGAYSEQGWPQFFPYCALVKTPLTLFVLMGLAAAAFIRRWYGAGKTWRARAGAVLASLYRAAPLWTLFTVYWTFAITSRLNIGHRHILPTYPPMLMLAGGAWLWLIGEPRAAAAAHKSSRQRDRRNQQPTRWLPTQRWPILAGIAIASTALFAAESLWRWPNYLAYFNQLAGGPSLAYRHLVDSSLDWGQELRPLKRWLVKEQLDRSAPERIYLSYFGTGKPSYYGISATLLPCFGELMRPQIPEPLEAGTYCISATMLQNVYTLFPGRWSRQYEQIYQQLTSNVRAFVASGPDGRNQLIAKYGENGWLKLFRHYEHARLARLTSFLRQREPDFQINNSILVYRLGASDLSRAIDGPPIELDEKSFSNIWADDSPDQ